jgi:alkylation response protein AidB-like acyl-CoA dehydrogenase
MGMTTTAVRSTDGTYYTVNGTKMWITNGTVDGVSTGDKFIVYVKTGNGRAATDLSAFIIEKGVTNYFFKNYSSITHYCNLTLHSQACQDFLWVKRF